MTIDWSDVVSKFYPMIQPAVDAGMTVAAVWYCVHVGFKIFKRLVINDGYTDEQIRNREYKDYYDQRHQDDDIFD